MREPRPHRPALGALKFARENKLQIACHAMGDRAAEHVVEFYQDEEPWMGRYPSVRIEHATVLSDELIDRIKAGRVDFGLVTNIDFFFAEYDSYSQNLTDTQFARTYPVRDVYRSIDKAALPSDCPATTWADPDNLFMSVQAAVTRKAYNGADIVPEQAISVAQALLMFTQRARLLSDFGNVVRSPRAARPTSSRSATTSSRSIQARSSTRR
jgi:predicted amidohydrolase YtcJ